MRLALMFCLLLPMAVNAAAGIYRWTDAAGQVRYGDSPPPDARDVKKMRRAFGTPANAATEAGAEVTATQDPAVARCELLRGQLKAYESAVSLIERNAQGAEREYTQDEKQNLIARTQAQVAEGCGSASAP